MQKLRFILIFLLSSQMAWSQEPVLDSLQQRLDNLDVYDEKYVDLLNDISFEYLKSDPSKSSYYINLAISISKELDYTKGLLRATANKGSSYWVIGLQDEALSYYLLALTYDSENHPLEYARLNNNIAEVFKKRKLYDSAFKYYDQALLMIKEKLDVSPVILTANIAEVYLMQMKLDSATYYYDLCLNEALKQQHKRGLAYSYDGLAELSFYKNDVDSAKELQNKSLAIRKEINDVRGEIQSLIKLGTYQLHDREFEAAISFWNKAEELAIQYRALDLLNDVYYIKFEHYRILEQYKEAAQYINQYQIIKDSIQSQEFVSSLDRIKGALLSEISEAENKLLRQQQVRDRAVNRARISTIIVVVILGLSITILVYQIRKRKKLKNEAEREHLFTESLLKLSKEVNLRQPGFDEFISDFLVSSSKSLDSERASYWFYESSSQQMICYKLMVNGEFKQVPEPLDKKQYPLFFAGLETKRTLAINDIQDSKYSDLSTQFLRDSRIKSLIHASLFLNDKLIGFISFSSIGEKREWDIAEQRYIGSLADIMISAFAYNQSKILEKEKEDLIDKLQTRNKSLKEFNSVISHNLREPLTQVIGLTEVLDSTVSNKTDDINRIITGIANAGQKIDRSIKDLSTVLNEKDPTKKDYKQTSLKRVLKEVYDLLPNEIKLIDPKIDHELEIDKILTYKPFLFDILYHLISNSIKFRKQDKKLKLKIALKEKDQQFVLSVKDNGLGIDLKKFGDKLFRMYQRFHLNVDGRGIGLYLVKNRVNTLGGDINVKSKVDQGTTFTITLPTTIPSKLSS